MFARQILRRIQSYRRSKGLKTASAATFSPIEYLQPLVWRASCFKCFRVPPAAIPYRLRPTRPAFFGVTFRYRKTERSRGARAYNGGALDLDLSRARIQNISRRNITGTILRSENLADCGAKAFVRRISTTRNSSRRERNDSFPASACLCSFDAFSFHRISISLFSSRRSI